MAYYASSPPPPPIRIVNGQFQVMDLEAWNAQMKDWQQYLSEAQQLAPLVAQIPGIYTIPGTAGATLRGLTNIRHESGDYLEELQSSFSVGLEKGKEWLGEGIQYESGKLVGGATMGILMALGIGYVGYRLLNTKTVKRYL